MKKTMTTILALMLVCFCMVGTCSVGYADDLTVQSAQEARQNGATAADLREQGYSAAMLMDAGYVAPQLAGAGYPATELHDLGFNAAMLHQFGNYSVQDLIEGGYPRPQIMGAGFSAGELTEGGFSPITLYQAGFTLEELRTGGANMGVLLFSLVAAGDLTSSPFDAGFTDADLRQFFAIEGPKDGGYAFFALAYGNSLSALLHSGLTLAQMRDLGLTAWWAANIRPLPELLAAGYTARELYEAHIPARLFLEAGFKVRQLKGFGFTADELKEAGIGLAELKLAGYSATELWAAGFTVAELKRSGFTLAQLKDAGVSPAQLKHSGFTLAELKSAGFTLAELRSSGFTITDFIDAGYKVGALKRAGFSVKELLAAGFTREQLLRAGFTESEIAQASGGKSATQSTDTEGTPGELTEEDAKAAREGGATAREMIAQGYSPALLKAAGFTPSEMLFAGVPRGELGQLFSVQELRADGWGAMYVLLAGYDVDALLEAGFAAADLVTPNVLAVLRNNGSDMGRLLFFFAATQTQGSSDLLGLLRETGFTNQELQAFFAYMVDRYNEGAFTTSGFISGFMLLRMTDQTPLSELRQLGLPLYVIADFPNLTIADFLAAGYTVAEMKDAGIDAARLKEAGVHPDVLKAAGYTAKQLVAAGFSALDLLKAGFTVSELRNAGFSAADFKASGISAADLKAAGFTLAELKEAGFSARELLKTFNHSGLAPDAMTKLLMEAGFSANDLLDAGFSIADLKGAGFSLAQILAAFEGRPNTTGLIKELKAAGFTLAELLAAGFTEEQLLAAGYTRTEIAQAQGGSSGSDGGGDLQWPEGYPAVGGPLNPGGVPGGNPGGTPGGGIPPIPPVVESNTNNQNAVQSTGPGATEIDPD